MKKIIVFFSAILLLASCNGTWLMYDTSQKDRLYFEVPESPRNISFSLISDSEITYTIPVYLMGIPSDSDRNFSVEFLGVQEGETILVNDEEIPVVTAREGVDFEVGDCILPAGAVSTPLVLTIHRSPDMESSYFSIRCRIVEDGSFRAADQDSTELTAIMSREFQIYVSDSEPVCPEWWSNTVKVGYNMYVGNFIPAKYRKFLELFHEIEEKNPTLYYQMVDRYGENIDNDGIKAGFFSTENPTVWATYVLCPLFDYYLEYYAEYPEEQEKSGDVMNSNTSWRNPINLLR